MQTDAELDCLVVGGGPAGLTAALYLARFRRKVRVVDSGASRAKWIPRSHNVPGFPDGVHGEDFLQALTRQASSFGAELHGGRVLAAEAGDDCIVASLEDSRLLCRTLILATGVVETVPPAPGMAQAIHAGVVRVCPICDGFEGQGRAIAVLGDGDHAARETLFLRTYATSVTLALTPEGRISTPVAQALATAGVAITRTEATAISATPDGVTMGDPGNGEPRRYDLLYVAFGVTPQVKLMRDLGVALDEDGRVRVSEKQETSVPGVFAAGDVVRGLNQISVAVGEAAIAATAVHNRLERRLC
jgi:thioredoxin reductase (NADPH)